MGKYATHFFDLSAWDIWPIKDIYTWLFMKCVLVLGYQNIVGTEFKLWCYYGGAVRIVALWLFVIMGKWIWKHTEYCVITGSIIIIISSQVPPPLMVRLSSCLPIPK